MGIRSFYQPSDFAQVFHEPTKRLLAYIWEQAKPIYYVAQLDWGRFQVFPKCGTAFKLNAGATDMVFEFIDPSETAEQLSVAHQQAIIGLVLEIRKSVRADSLDRPHTKSLKVASTNPVPVAPKVKEPQAAPVAKSKPTPKPTKPIISPPTKSRPAPKPTKPMTASVEMLWPIKPKPNAPAASPMENRVEQPTQPLQKPRPEFPTLRALVKSAQESFNCPDLESKVSDNTTAILIYVGSVLIASILVSNLQLIRWDATASATALRVQAALSHVRQGKRFSMFDEFVAAVKKDCPKWTSAATHEEKKPKGYYDSEMAGWCRKVGGVPGYSRLGRAGYGVLGLEDSGAVGRKAKKMKVVVPTAEDLQRLAEEAAAAEKQRHEALHNRIHELRLRAEKFRRECAQLRALTRGPCHTAAQRDLNGLRLEKAMQYEVEAVKLETLAESLTQGTS